MKKLKSIAIISLVVIICLSFAACGSKLTKQKAVGVWHGTYEYNGNDFEVTFSLEANGDFERITLKNGDLYKTTTGYYEIKGNKLEMHTDGEDGVTPYKYNGKALVNNNHNFYKVG